MHVTATRLMRTVTRKSRVFGLDCLTLLLKVRGLVHLYEDRGRVEYSVMPQVLMSHSTLVFQHSTAQHSTVQHSTSQHSTA